MHVHCILTFRRFSKSRRICNWYKECNTTSYTISIFVLIILTLIAQSSLLQIINRRLKFVPQFVILVAGYVTFSSYSNISNVLFQNSVCTKVMMKTVQLQSSWRWKVMYVTYMFLTTFKIKGPLVIEWVIWVGMQCLSTVGYYRAFTDLAVWTCRVIPLICMWHMLTVSLKRMLQNLDFLFSCVQPYIQ